MRGKRFYNCSLSVFIIFAILAVDLFIPFNSSAELKVPEVKLSVKPLDLSRTPTTEEIMAAGQLGGQLYPTDDIQIEDSPSPSSPPIKGGENTPLDPLLIEGKVPSPLAGEGKGEGDF